MCHGQAVVDFPLKLCLVCGSEEVDSFDVQLDREEEGEVEAGVWLLAVETLRDLPELSGTWGEESYGGCRVAALHIDADSLRQTRQFSTK